MIKQKDKPKKQKTPKSVNNKKKQKAPKPVDNVKQKSKKSADSKKQKTKISISLFHQLRTKLIVSFMIPVCCIVILGVVSYQKAYSAIITSYETSASQTMNMMNQYLTLAIDTIRSTYKSYLNEDEVIKYLKGIYAIDPAKQTNTKKSYVATLKTSVNTDSLVSNIYLFADDIPEISTATIEEEKPYTAYTQTEEGAIIKADKYNYYLFGNKSSEANTIFATDDSVYALRLARGYSQGSAAMIIDINKESVINTLSSIDVGEGGHVALVTFDGTEFYADGTSENQNTIFTGSTFYQDAVANEKTSGMEYVTYDGQQYLFLYSKIVDYNAVICTLIPQSVIVAQASSIKTITVLLVVIAVFIAAILGSILSNHINRNIKYILAQLKKVSDGDLTTHLSVKSKDEFRLLGEGVNTMITNMKNLITNVTAASDALNHTALQVAESADTFVGTSRDIQDAISEIESGVINLDENSADCMVQMDTLSSKIHDVTTGTNEIGTLTDAASNSITEGITSMDRLTESAKQTSEKTENVIQAIEALSEKSRSIGQIVESINHIAKETNLLSLNASIEAARAGEAGRGFAVVAEQIRELADQSAASAGQIQKIIEDIISNTSEVVSIAKEAADTVTSQESAMQQTADAFQTMDTHIHSLITSLSQITLNVENMEQARSTTLNAIESISSVSAQTAAGSKNVQTTVNAQQSAITTLEQASDSVKAKAEELAELLRQFII